MYLTVDLLITVQKQKVVLIRRAKNPYQGMLALPGGHVEDSDETVLDACLREAKEELGFVATKHELECLTILDQKNRDPRPGRRAAVVYHLDLLDNKRLQSCQAASDAASFDLYPISELKENDLAFDHFLAISLIQQLHKEGDVKENLPAFKKTTKQFLESLP